MYDFDERYQTGRRRQMWLLAGGVAIVVALVVMAALGVWFMRRSAIDNSPQRIAQLTQALESTEANQRLAAANALIVIQGSTEDLLMTKAEALLRLELAEEAMATLEKLRVGMAGHLPDDAVPLLARSYFARARRQISRATRLTIDLTDNNARQLLAEARRVIPQLKAESKWHAEALRLEAEALDVEATLHHMRLKGHPTVVKLLTNDDGSTDPLGSSDLSDLLPATDTASTPDNSVQPNDLNVVLPPGMFEAVPPAPGPATPDELQADVAGLHSAGAELTSIQRDLARAEQELAAACERALQADPGHPLPRELQLRSALRRGDLTALRRLARGLADQPRLSRPQAGRVAMLLLDLDEQHGVYSSPADVALAERLINHPQLFDASDSDFHTAEVYLAFRQGHYDQADDLGRRYAQNDSQPRRLARILARIWNAKGDHQRAIAAITHFDEMFETPEFNYEMGVTLLAQGQASRGRDHLRRALELRRDHLPARIAIARSLIDEGFVLEAEQDITAAAEINPNHPAVKEVRAHLYVEKLDHEGLAQMIDAGLGTTPPQPWEVALAAAMALDDTLAVRQLSQQHLAADATDALALVTRAWLESGPTRRPDVAAVLVRAWLERMRIAPLDRIADPDFSQPHAHLSSQRLSSIETDLNPDRITFAQLVASRYIPTLHEQAYDMVGQALELKPDPTLMEYAAQLSVWLGRDSEWNLAVLSMDIAARQDPLAAAAAAFTRRQDDTARRWLERLAVSERNTRPTAKLIELGLALRADDQPLAYNLLPDLLELHPRAYAAIYLAIDDAIARERPEQIAVWLETAERIDTTAAQFARARWCLADGRPNDAMVEMQIVDRHGVAGSLADRHRAELVACGFVDDGQANRAVREIERVALTAPRQRFALTLAAADLLIHADKLRIATSYLATSLHDATQPPWRQDELLARAIFAMPPDRLLNLLESLQRFAPDTPILELYRARVLIRLDRGDSARVILRGLLARNPDSPRIALETANLDLTQGRKEQARQLLYTLRAKGGRIGRAADALWEAHNQPESTSENASENAKAQN